MAIAGARDALIMRTLAALIRRRHQSHQAAQLAPVLDVPPRKISVAKVHVPAGPMPRSVGKAVDIAAERRFWIHRDRCTRRV